MARTSLTASIEWPPRSKKLSRTETVRRPSTSQNSAAIPASRASRGGARSSPAVARFGAGSARWSTLPSARRGIASSRTNAAGTMAASSSAWR